MNTKNSMTDPAGPYAVPELNGKNWRQWFIRMENYLRIQGRWEVTCQDPFEGKAEKSELEETNKYDYEKMQQARCRIINSLNEEYSGHVTCCETAHEAWRVLKDLYQNTSSLRESELREKLAKTRKMYDMTIDQYMNQIILLVDELRQVNVEMPEEQVANIVLDGLPEQYHMVVLTLKHYHEPLTMARVRLSLTYEENYQRKGRLHIAQEAEEKPTPQPTKPRCQFCKKPGHTLQQCTRFKAAYPPKENKHSKETQEVEWPMSLMAISPQLNTNDQHKWIIDSGATWHMTGNKQFLDVNTMKQYSANIEIADGSHLTTEAIGTVPLTLDDECDTTIILKDVVYVPGLAANLLSVTCMTENGASVTFDNGICTITQGKRTIKAELLGAVNYCLSATAKIWHERLGHIHSNRIKKMELPHNMTEICEACMENKQSATKFKSKEYNYQPLGLLYLDIVGPIQPETPAGQRYFLSVLDHNTKVSLIFLMDNKGATEKYAKLAINVLEQKAGGKYTVKAIRTDLGQEFLGRKLGDFLAERGIAHEKTAGYTPQQNDAERLHRDIREHASTMLNATYLPSKYWGEAVCTYIHIRNRIPPTHGEDTRSPLHKLSGSIQPTDHLRVFGCEAWVLKLEAEHGGKFMTRSEKGIFIGYENTTTYRVLLHNRLTTSRHVRFNERKMGEYNRPINEETSQYQMDLVNEPNQWESESDELDTEYEEAEESTGQRYNLQPYRQTSFIG